VNISQPKLRSEKFDDDDDDNNNNNNNNNSGIIIIVLTFIFSLLPLQLFLSSLSSSTTYNAKKGRN